MKNFPTFGPNDSRKGGGSTPVEGHVFNAQVYSTALRPCSSRSTAPFSESPRQPGADERVDGRLIRVVHEARRTCAASGCR